MVSAKDQGKFPVSDRCLHLIRQPLARFRDLRQEREGALVQPLPRVRRHVHRHGYRWGETVLQVREGTSMPAGPQPGVKCRRTEFDSRPLCPKPKRNGDRPY